jgi:hypothetical protein
LKEFDFVFQETLHFDGQQTVEQCHKVKLFASLRHSELQLKQFVTLLTACWLLNDNIFLLEGSTKTAWRYVVYYWRYKCLTTFHHSSDEEKIEYLSSYAKWLRITCKDKEDKNKNTRNLLKDVLLDGIMKWNWKIIRNSFGCKSKHQSKYRLLYWWLYSTHTRYWITPVQSGVLTPAR